MSLAPCKAIGGGTNWRDKAIEASEATELVSTGIIMSLQEGIYEEMEEDLSDILPNSWEWLNNTLGHLNSILFTGFFVLAIVVAYIVYIIHLYDTGKLGGTPNSKPPPRRKKQSAAEKIAEERWNKKFM